MQQSHNLSGNTLCEQLLLCLGANFLETLQSTGRSYRDEHISISGPFQLSLHTSDATSCPGTSPVKWSKRKPKASCPMVQLRKATCCNKQTPCVVTREVYFFSR